jgi:catechol 2,3-dioxygenase-like lactoylglutathione lyase family enzyme
VIVDRANTVLYCRRWPETVAFYRDVCGFETTFANDWFVEFRIACDVGFLSIADAARASVGAVEGRGVTLAWRTPDLAAAHAHLAAAGVVVTPIERRWGALAFFCHDPEGNRVELWAEPDASEPG